MTGPILTAREIFFVGQAVKTTEPGHLLKGQTERIGNVVGFCKDPHAVRVSWSWMEDDQQRARAVSLAA